MKKIIAAIIIAATVVLTACGGGSVNVSQSTYENGSRALEIMEKYNKAEITGEDAVTRLKGLESALESEQADLQDKPTQGLSNLRASTAIFLFIAAIEHPNIASSTTYDQEKELRDAIS